MGKAGPELVEVVAEVGHVKAMCDGATPTMDYLPKVYTAPRLMLRCYPLRGAPMQVHIIYILVYYRTCFRQSVYAHGVRARCSMCTPTIVPGVLVCISRYTKFGKY